MTKQEDAAERRARAEKYRQRFIGKPSKRNENARHARKEGSHHAKGEMDGPILNRRRGRRSSGRVRDSRRA